LQEYDKKILQYKFQNIEQVILDIHIHKHFVAGRIILKWIYKKQSERSGLD